MTVFVVMAVFVLLAINLRVTLSIVVLCILLITGVVVVTNFQEELRLDRCTWVPNANVMLGDVALSFPARANTSLNFIRDPADPDRSVHVTPEGVRSRGDVTMYFCDTDLAGSPNVVSIQLHRSAVVPVAAAIGFTDCDDLGLVNLSNRGAKPAEIDEIAGTPDVFVRDPRSVPSNSPYAGEDLRTAGWVKGTHAVFTACRAVETGGPAFSCSYTILRRADAVKIQFTAVQTDTKPILGQRNPAVLDDLLIKFDAVLEHYAQPHTTPE